MKKIDMYNQVPEAFHAQLCDTLEGLTEEKTTHFSVKKYVAIGAVAILACASLTVGAAEFFKWHKGATEKFGTEKELEDKLTAQGAAIPEEDVLASEGLTFRGLQAIKADGYYYFLVGVTLPENIQWNEDILFEESQVLSDQEVEGVTGNFVSSPDENGEVLLEINVHIQEDVMYGETLTVRLTNLIQTEKSQYVSTLVEGEWELTFDLPQDAETVIFETDKGLQINGHELLIDKVEVSPFEISLFTEEQAARHAVCCHYATLTGVQYQDGSVVEEWTWDFGSAGTKNDAGEFAFGFTLDTAIDVEKISALIFMDGENEITFALDGSAEVDAAEKKVDEKGMELAELLHENSEVEQISDLHIIYMKYDNVFLTDGKYIYLWDALCGNAEQLVSLVECGYSDTEGGEIAVGPGENILLIHPTATDDRVYLYSLDAMTDVMEYSADEFWPTANYEGYKSNFCQTKELRQDADEKYSEEAYLYRDVYYCLYSADGSVENMELLEIGQYTEINAENGGE